MISDIPFQQLLDCYGTFLNAGLTMFGNTFSNKYGTDRVPEHLVAPLITTYKKMCGVQLFIARVPHLKSKPWVLFHPEKMPEVERAHWRMVMRGLVAGMTCEKRGCDGEIDWIN